MDDVSADMSVCPPGDRKMLIMATRDGKYTDYHMQVKREEVQGNE